MPELSPPEPTLIGFRDVDAVLDVVAFGHATAPNLLIDATVRHPVVASLRASAAKTTGFAADAAGCGDNPSCCNCIQYNKHLSAAFL